MTSSKMKTKTKKKTKKAKLVEARPEALVQLEFPVVAMMVSLHRGSVGAKALVQVFFQEHEPMKLAFSAPGAVVLCRGGSS